MKIPMICIAVAAGFAAPAWSQTAIDAQTLKQYGGSYASDCASSAAPHLRVAADTLIVEQGTKRMTGRNVQSAASYFGQSPPPNYQTALMSEVRAGEALMFIVYRDRSGQYITVEGHPKVEAALGKTLLARKYRQCGAASKEAAAAPAVAPQPEPIALAYTLLKDARFKSAYYTALGARNKEDWLAKLEGPGSPLENITIADKEYIVASVCKDHDCGDNNALLLYSAAQRVVFGKILDQRRSMVIGAPPPQVAAELERLWAAQWRRR